MAEQPAKSTKRQVKNPETFRERALKATEATDNPKRLPQIKRRTAGVFRPVFTPLGRFFKRLFARQPFKTLARLCHWIGLVLVPPYLRNSWQELKLVTWPNWRQSRQLTFAVLAFAVVFGGAVASVDYGLDKLFRHILLK